MLLKGCTLQSCMHAVRLQSTAKHMGSLEQCAVAEVILAHILFTETSESCGHMLKRPMWLYR